MAEIMERMAEQKQNAVQAAERTLCDRLNSLAAALTAAADAADVARGGSGGKSGSAATPASPVEAVDGSGAGGAGRRGRKRKAAEGGRNLPRSVTLLRLWRTAPRNSSCRSYRNRVFASQRPV